jgi:hypothetical protein
MDYPRTIDDGAGGRMTFLGVSHDQYGERLDVTSTVDPGAGPPMHVHHLQSETVTVRSGRVGVSVAGEPDRFAGPGEQVHFAAGVPTVSGTRATRSSFSTARSAPRTTWSTS